MFEHDSIADIHEDKLVKYLLAVPYWRHWMFDHYGIPRDPICRDKVLLSTIPGRLPRQGDIDVLLCGPGRFEEAVAYQVKRVKVSEPPKDVEIEIKEEDLKKIQGGCIKVILGWLGGRPDSGVTGGGGVRG